MQLRTAGVVALFVLATSLFPVGARQAATPPGRSAHPKVYISADMEGISGVVGREQIVRTGTEFARGRQLMLGDVNAAIRGAVAAGATEIVVNDSHGDMRNLLIEDLHPAASLIAYNFKRDGMVEGLDATFDAALFIGYHAKADSPIGVFAHSQNAGVRDVRVNGRSVGEGGLNALVAAWYGVPVVLVTGDQVAVAQTQEVARQARGVVVKRAINSRAAILRPLAEVRGEIETAAREAVASARKPPPQRAGPFRFEIAFRSGLIPEVAEVLPFVERPAPDTVAFSADSMVAGFRIARVLYRNIDPH